METFATGLKRISDYCAEAGCKFEFQKKAYGFCIVFYRQKDAYLGNDTQVSTENTQVDTQVTAPNTQVDTQVNVENTQVDTQVTAQNTQVGSYDSSINLSKRELDIIEFCSTPRSKTEIIEHLNLKSIKSIRIQINNLLRLGILEMTVPEKPRSGNQRYVVRR